MSFAKNSISVFATRISLILISIASSIVVTRILGPDNRGKLAILMLVAGLLVDFGNLGIGNANLYYIGKKKYSVEKIVSNSLSVAMILGAFLLIIAYLFFHLGHQKYFNEIELYLTYFIFGLIPLRLVQKYIQYALIGRQEFTSRNLIVLVPAITNFALVMCLVVIFRLNIFGVSIATFASNLLAAMMCIYYISKSTKICIAFDYKLFIQSVQFGMIPFMALVIMNLNFKADIFLIKYFLDSTSVGLYSLSVSVVDKLGLLPEAMGLVLFSKISNVKENKANIITPIVCRLSMFIAIAGGVVLILTGNFIVPFVYGEEFRPSVQPLFILIPGTIFMTLFIILHGDLSGRGRAKITLYIFSIAFVINIFLNLILIPRFGINGASVASSISYTIGSISLAVVFAKVNKIPFWDLFVIKKIDLILYIYPLIVRIKSKFVTRKTDYHSI